MHSCVMFCRRQKPGKRRQRRRRVCMQACVRTSCRASQRSVGTSRCLFRRPTRPARAPTAGRHRPWAAGASGDRAGLSTWISPVTGSYSTTRGCTVGPPSAAAAASAIAACYAELNLKDQHTKAGMQQVNGAALQGPVLSPLPLAVPPPPPPLHDWCSCRIVMHPRHHDREHPVACTTGICLPGTGTTLAHFAWGAACAHVAPPPGPSRSALC